MELNFLVATLNVARKVFPSEEAIADMIDLSSSPMLIAVALQESHSECQDAVTRYLASAGYSTLAHESIGDANRNILFVKEEAVPRVSEVFTLSVATLNGGIGSRNKGGVMIRFRIDDISVAFVGCHLAAHRKYLSERNADANEVMDMVGRSETEHGALDMICVYGDLNYRLSFIDDGLYLTLKTVSPNEAVERELTKHADHSPLEWKTVHDQYLTAENYSGLSELCQLRRILAKNEPPWTGFQEHSKGINFPPTFKWATESTYEPLRLPAFCDRILLKTANHMPLEVIQRTYESPRKVTFSDHRPVVATFTLICPSQ